MPKASSAKSLRYKMSSNVTESSARKVESCHMFWKKKRKKKGRGKDREKKRKSFTLAKTVQ
jgi:hypothetical protein